MGASSERSPAIGRVAPHCRRVPTAGHCTRGVAMREFPSLRGRPNSQRSRGRVGARPGGGQPARPPPARLSRRRRAHPRGSGRRSGGAGGAGSMKLAEVSEFTTSCNFCSCGCGMVAAVRDGKLIDHGGGLRPHRQPRLAVRQRHRDVATHASPKRLTAPLYRAPGSDHWEELSWKDAAEKVARKIKKTRDETWIATEKVGGGRFRSTARTRSPSWAARRTRTRSATSSRRRRGCSGCPSSSTRRDFDTAPRSPVWGPRSVAAR